MNKETLKEILEIIKQIDVPERHIKPLVNLLENYDQKDSSDLAELLVIITDILIYMSELQIKADAYDTIKENHEILSASVQEMKDEYNQITSGKLPTNQPVPATLEE